MKQKSVPELCKNFFGIVESFGVPGVTVAARPKISDFQLLAPFLAIFNKDFQ